MSNQSYRPQGTAGERPEQAWRKERVIDVAYSQKRVEPSTGSRLRSSIHDNGSRQGAFG